MTSLTKLEDAMSLGIRDAKAMADQLGIELKGAKNVNDVRDLIVKAWLQNQVCINEH